MASEPDILIVEDSPTQALLLRHMLAPYAYPVAIARSGEEALARIRERPPALVISDYIMPGINGRNLCLQIRQDPALKAIPFLLMTAQSDSIEGLAPPDQGGPDAILIKPVTREQLDQTLAPRLPRKQSFPVSSESALPGAGSLLEPDLPVFDGRRLKENLSGDLRLYNKIITAFFEECPKQLAHLERAFADSNRHAVELMAHSIKGSATTLGGERLRVAAMLMEKAARSAEWSQLHGMRAQLRQEYERLNAALAPDLSGERG